MTLKAWGVFLGIAGALGVAAACGSGDDKKGSTFNPNDFTGGKSSAGGSGTGNFSGSNGTGGSLIGAGGTTGNVPDSSTCPGTVYAAESVPVDIYIMFDQSTSMSGTIPGSTQTWWDAATTAMKAFAADPRAASLGVGIQYFGLPDGVTLNTSLACPIAQYATPEVEIAPLSTNSQNIIASINRHAIPTTFTPTEPALQGAIDHMNAWAPAHNGRAPAVVLVTDGYPSLCDLEGPDLAQPSQIVNIANRAAAAYQGVNKIRTFVVGFESGGALSNLDQIALAGGTKQAFRISGGDVGRQFVNALLSISNSTLQCSFPIPPPPTGQLPDGKVGLIFTPSATRIPQLIPYLGPGSGASTCALKGNNGWYFDAYDFTTAKQIIVCPGNCDTFGAGTVSLRLGCAPNDPIN